MAEAAAGLNRKAARGLERSQQRVADTPAVRARFVLHVGTSEELHSRVRQYVCPCLLLIHAEITKVLKYCVLVSDVNEWEEPNALPREHKYGAA